MQPPRTLLQTTKETVGVDRAAGADHVLPPAGLAGDRVGVRDILVAGERVADEDGVRARFVQCAIGAVGEGERRQMLPAVEQQTVSKSLGRVLDAWETLVHGAEGLGRVGRRKACFFEKKAAKNFYSFGFGLSG